MPANNESSPWSTPEPGDQHPRQTPAGPPAGADGQYQGGGQYQPGGYYPGQSYAAPGANPMEAKSRVVAGLLGIFLGALGIHNFYVGRTTIAVVQLLISVLSLGFLSPVSGIWGLIEGILYLASHSPRWSTDAQGNPLRS